MIVIPYAAIDRGNGGKPRKPSSISTYKVSTKHFGIANFIKFKRFQASSTTTITTAAAAAQL